MWLLQHFCIISDGKSNMVLIRQSVGQYNTCQQLTVDYDISNSLFPLDFFASTMQ